MKKLFSFVLVTLIGLQLAYGQAKSCLTGGVIEHNDGNLGEAMKQLECAIANISQLKPEDQVKAHYYRLSTLAKAYAKNVYLEQSEIDEFEAMSKQEGEKKKNDLLKKRYEENLLSKYPSFADQAIESYRFVYEKDAARTYKGTQGFKILGVTVLIVCQFKMGASLSAKEPNQAEYREAIKWARNLEFVTSSFGDGALTISSKVVVFQLLLSIQTHADSLEAEKEMKFFEDNYAKVILPEDLNDERKREAFGMAFGEGLAFIVNYKTERGLVEEAKATAKKALELFPNNDRIMNAEADIYLHPSQVEQALPRFKQELAANPNNVELNLKMAQVYRRLAERDMEEKALPLVDSLKNHGENMPKDQQEKLISAIKEKYAAYEPLVEDTYKLYETALANNPGDKQKELAYFNYAVTLNNSAKYYGDFNNALPYTYSKMSQELDKKTKDLLAKALEKIEASHKLNPEDQGTIDVCYKIAFSLGNTEKADYYNGLKK